VPSTPRPIAAATKAPAAPRPHRTPRPSSLNQRLKQLIPTGAPPTPEAPKVYRNLGAIQPGVTEEPTPPPDVLAATKYIYEENAGQAFGEQRIKMYVTSARKVGFVTVCHGWLLRYPFPPRHGTYNLDSNFSVAPKPIIEANVTYVCNGHFLTPFTAPAPSSSPTP